MKITLIGLGNRGQKYVNYINQCTDAQLISVCDNNPKNVANITEKQNTQGFTSLDDLLRLGEKPDFAVVCVPHNAYVPILEKLAAQGIHILKEKPLARNLEEAQHIKAIVEKNGIHMMVATQRRFSELFNEAKKQIPNIGIPTKINLKYALGLNNPNEGWRASTESSGGGALSDMGYHAIDFVLQCFGKPSHFNLQKTTALTNVAKNAVENSAILDFTYTSHQGPNLIGVLDLSRLGRKKKESIEIIGTEGSIVIKNHKGILEVIKDKQVIFSKNLGDKHFEQSNINMVQHFVRFLQGQENKLIGDYRDHFQNVELIDIATTAEQIKNFKKPAQDYDWPIVTPEMETAILKQLHQGELSIYDRSGIIAEFEDRFKAYHGTEYALLTNSGTNALYSLFRAIDLKPGDEVIVPNYTFHATASPLHNIEGVKTVLCDCLPNGNINPEAIKLKINNQTKAIIITHMWGQPCDMDAIVKIAQDHKIILLEDCSHAHGARYRGKLVGTFGDAAMWSLQGQKIIAGGELGIMVTNNRDIHTKALFLGNFNKRCKQEALSSDEVYPYWETGFGFKFRPHPLAVAIADQQFRHMDEWLAQKDLYAKQIISVLKEFDFIRVEDYPEHVQPAWYALVFHICEARAGFTADDFVRKLHDHGLSAIDKPKATKPLHHLPLFQGSLNQASASFFQAHDPYPASSHFYKTAIKLPVWAFPEDQAMVTKYVEGIRRAALEMQEEYQATKRLKIA